MIWLLCNNTNNNNDSNLIRYFCGPTLCAALYEIIKSTSTPPVVAAGFVLLLCYGQKKKNTHSKNASTVLLDIFSTARKIYNHLYINKTRCLCVYICVIHSQGHRTDWSEIWYIGVILYPRMCVHLEANFRILMRGSRKMNILYILIYLYARQCFERSLILSLQYF